MDKIAQATPESIQAAYDYCVEQRVINGLDPDPNAAPIVVRPCAVLAFNAQQQADKLFTAPSALPRVHALQLRESQDREQLADAILMIAEVVVSDGDMRNKARYAATSALRSLDPRWTKAAQDRAIEAGVVAMRTEGGAAVCELPMAHLDSLARLLFGAMVTAYTSTLDGSATLSNAEYLRIAGR